MDLKRNLGNVVRQRRHELGLSQVELAELMRGGMQQADVSRIERGFLPWPRPDLLYALAAALSLHPLELIARSGWLSEEELERYRPRSSAPKPLVILGIPNPDEGDALSSAAALGTHFRTLVTYDGGTLVDTIVSQAPELAIVHQKCPHVCFDRLESTLQTAGLPTKIIVVGDRRSTVPRDLRFHYLKAPATTEALGSLLGAMGYRQVVAV